MKTKKSISDDIRKAIALRAYHIWEREGRPHGREHDHWQMAEAEILSEQPAEEAAHSLTPHPPETVTAAKKTAKKKTAVEKAAPEMSAAEKPVAAKASASAKKDANGAAKTVIAAVKTKKTVKAKPAKPAPR